MELMRHESIETTLKFYVDRNAEKIAETQDEESARSFQAAVVDVTGVLIDDQEVRLVERPLLLDCHVKAVAISPSLCEECLPCKIVPDSLLA